MGEQIKLQIEVCVRGQNVCLPIAQMCFPTTLGVDKRKVKRFLLKLITDLSNSNLPAGGQKVVHVPSTLGRGQLWLRKEH